jgi:hypothetical protein
MKKMKLLTIALAGALMVSSQSVQANPWDFFRTCVRNLKGNVARLVHFVGEHKTAVVLGTLAYMTAAVSATLGEDRDFQKEGADLLPQFCAWLAQQNYPPLHLKDLTTQFGALLARAMELCPEQFLSDFSLFEPR